MWHEHGGKLLCRQHRGGIGAGLMAMTLACRLLGALSKVINVKERFFA